MSHHLIYWHVQLNTVVAAAAVAAAAVLFVLLCSCSHRSYALGCCHLHRSFSSSKIDPMKHDQKGERCYFSHADRGFYTQC